MRLQTTLAVYNLSLPCLTEISDLVVRFRINLRHASSSSTLLAYSVQLVLALFSLRNPYYLLRSKIHFSLFHKTILVPLHSHLFRAKNSHVCSELKFNLKVKVFFYTHGFLDFCYAVCWTSTDMCVCVEGSKR